MLSKMVTKFAGRRGYSYIEQNGQLFLYYGSSTKDNPVLVWDIKNIGNQRLYLCIIGYEKYHNFPMIVDETQLNGIISLISRKQKKGK